MGTAAGWPYLLAFSTVIAVIQVFILPFCPSSPRYLLIKLNKESLARQGGLELANFIIFISHLSSKFTLQYIYD